MLFAVNTLKSVDTIEVNFMESGHSFLPNDSDFSNISDAMKSQSHIYVPEDYVNLIKNCKKKNPFATNKMDGKFKTFAELNYILINRQKTECGEKVNWMRIKWMKFTRGSLMMQFKWAMVDEASTYTVDFCRNKRSVEATLERLQTFQPKRLYDGGVKIKGSKYDDLMGKLLKYQPRSIRTSTKNSNQMAPQKRSCPTQTILKMTCLGKMSNRQKSCVELN